MAKRGKPTVGENDFDALERLAHSITLENTRPLNARERKQWEETKRGRPSKPPGSKSVPTMITVEPTLLRQVDAYVKKAGISRSQLFAEAIRAHIGITRPKRKAG